MLFGQKTEAGPVHRRNAGGKILGQRIPAVDLVDIILEDVAQIVEALLDADGVEFLAWWRAQAEIGRLAQRLEDLVADAGVLLVLVSIWRTLSES